MRGMEESRREMVGGTEYGKGREGKGRGEKGRERDWGSTQEKDRIACATTTDTPHDHTIPLHSILI